MAIQTGMSCIELKDGLRTVAYKRFGVSKPSSLTESALHLAGAVLVTQATKYLPEYADKGLTQAMSDEVATANAAFVAGLTTRHEQ